VRSVVLLRYLSEPELREGITAITNRVEAFHGFAKWLSFGHDGILAGNDPDHHEKIVKFNELLANCAIYSTTLDITAAANDLIATGRDVDPEDLATIAPYITSKIRRFDSRQRPRSPMSRSTSSPGHAPVTTSEGSSSSTERSPNVMTSRSAISNGLTRPSNARWIRRCARSSSGTSGGTTCVG
jgi:hypothetical protein